MRLICPNCDAEYQVDDAAIPETGRDVQCSNCGHAWFQLPVEVEAAREAEQELFGDGPLMSSMATSGPDDTDAPENEPAPEALSPAVAEKPDPRPTGARQSLAESVMSVLREEAERETAARRQEAVAGARPADAGSMETQTELGLDTAPASASSEPVSAAARHIARLKGEEELEEPAVEERAASRRDLLPDIEEINSTLRASSDRQPLEDEDFDLPDIRPRRGGFRSGFVLMVSLAVLAALAYLMAPRIIAQMPAAAPAMTAYVDAVDNGRLWLDGVMQSASGALRSFSGDDG